MAARTRKQPRSAGILVPIGLLVVLGIIAYAILHPPAPPHHAQEQSAPTCPAAPVVYLGKYSIPAGPIAGYCQPQLENAVEIMLAARSLGLNTRPQEIGIMTAIGESGLRNLDFGDTAGPDSRGLFQQRGNYGPLSDRLDPYIASRAFFSRMLGVPGWNTRPPTEVAHAVQANADPGYYTQFWSRAVDLEFGITSYQLLGAHPHLP